MESDTNPRGFFGVIIPIKLLDNPDLTVGEKMVYAYVASYRKACFDTNDRIAERLGISKRTVQRALKNMTRLGFLVIENIGEDSNKRRIYAILDDPKKLEYLAKKGLLNREEPESFPQGFPQGRQNVTPPRQNVTPPRQNVTPPNRGEGRQNVTQRIKEENKNKAPGAAMPSGKPAGGAGAPRPKRKDFQTHEEYVEAIYAWKG